VESSATACPLCGTPIGTNEHDSFEDVPGPDSAENPTPRADAPAPSSTGSVFCNQCGHENPAGSRFCSACGARLQQAGRTAEPPPKRPRTVEPVGAPAPSGTGSEPSIGSRIGVIFGSVIAVIVVIFLFRAVRSDTPGTQAIQSQPVPAIQQMESTSPLPAGIEEQLAAIIEAANALDGDARIAKLREGVALLLSVDRFDRAAVEQEAIAEMTGLEEDWVLAGNHYYDWMGHHSGRERVEFARKAVAAYQRVLEINPDNLDARADMAFAYMSDPENPMQGIQELTAVLAADSLHIRANHFRGIMLLEIGRTDQALTQFRKVRRLINDESNPIFQEAGQYIDWIQGQGTAPGN